jgi:hypothetical protein
MERTWIQHLVRLTVTIEIDTLEQQQTEKFETEVKDVDRIRITKVYASCPGLAFWGLIGALQSDINICYPPQLSASP